MYSFSRNNARQHCEQQNIPSPETKVGITFFSNLLRESFTDPNPARSALQTKGHTFFCKENGSKGYFSTPLATLSSGSPSRRGATVGVNSGFYFPILSFAPLSIFHLSLPEAASSAIFRPEEKMTSIDEPISLGKLELRGSDTIYSLIPAMRER